MCAVGGSDLTTQRAKRILESQGDSKWWLLVEEREKPVSFQVSE